MEVEKIPRRRVVEQTECLLHPDSYRYQAREGEGTQQAGG
jgi:hypothetical protein